MSQIRGRRPPWFGSSFRLHPLISAVLARIIRLTGWQSNVIPIAQARRAIRRLVKKNGIFFDRSALRRRMEG
jgi:hypothetical protein